MQLHYGYKIINLTNDRFYFGVRKCKLDYDIFGDSYFGSGKILQQAIKKNGLENFSKEVVFVFENKKDAFDWERELITQDFIDANPLCYNIKPGGIGGSSFGENNGMYGKPKSNETKRKLSIALSGDRMKGENNGMYGKKHSEEIKQKMRDNHANFSGENNPFYGKRHSAETKLKQRMKKLGKKCGPYKKRLKENV